MSEPIVWLTIFVLSVFVGVEVISKVSSTLHTPLMSGANAIHGIILLGAILVTGYAETTLRWWSGWSRSCSRPSTWSAASWSPTGCCRCSPAGGRARAGGEAVTADPVWAQLVYLVARGLLHPRAQGALLAAHRPRRQPGRCRRRGRRLRRGVLLRRARPRACRSSVAIAVGTRSGWSAHGGCR